MATSTIGTGGTYSTIALWEADTDNDLVGTTTTETGALKNQEFTEEVTISGATTNATYYRTLTTDTGASFADNANVQTNALRYNASNGAGIKSTTAFTDAITVSENYFRMSKIQVQRTLAGSANRALYNSGVTDMRLERCIFESDNDAYVLHGWTRTKLYSCLIVSTSNACPSIYDGGEADNELVNCTLAVPSDKTPATDGIIAAFNSGWVVDNCAVFGVSNIGTSTGVTYQNTKTDDNTSLPSGVANVAYDTSTGSGFENITTATRDYRIKSTSALIGAGTTNTNGTPDIAGSSRPQGAAYDVGAWEFFTSTPATAFQPNAFQSNAFQIYGANFAVAFDPSIMAAMSWPWTIITIAKPQVVAAGQTPPDNVPS